MAQLKDFSRKIVVLAIVGGLAFWFTNLIISLTPIAAEYRSGLSISYFPMLLEALVGGLFIGFGISYLLFRFFDRIPTKDPILKSLVLSLIAFIFVTFTLEVPGKFFTNTSDALYFFLIGLLFNLVRFSSLGIAIGYQYKRQHINTGNR